MESTQEADFQLPELRMQAPTDGKACTAYAFINALRLNGTPMTRMGEDEVISKVQLGKNLESSDRVKISQELGLPYRQLSDALFEAPSVNGVMNLLNVELKKSPVVFAISRYLAKRPEAFREGKDNYHAVTAHLRTGVIDVIDPYSPDFPEKFDTRIPPDMDKFLQWIVSPYIQHLGVVDRNELMVNSKNTLSDEKSFALAIKGVASLYQTYSLTKV